MRLSPRLTLILVIVGVVLVVVVAAVVLVFPQISRMTNVEGQMSSLDDQVTQAENLLAARQEAKDRAAFTDAALLELAAAVPENPDLPSLIIELQDRAYESNVQLRVIEPSDLVQESSWVSMPITVTCWGSWADTVDFVQQVRKMERQVRIVETGSDLLDEDESADEAVEPLDEYSVETQLLIETYLIPSSESSSTVPAPAEPTP
jgi:Tfp pilus assembly protein PilO